MIVSASRRTDIPAFYADWFFHRIDAGYCAVPNPFNHQQVSRVSLEPDEVDAIVFWTRNPAPLFPRLRELSERGFRYYFLFTLINNPKPIDPYSPPLEKAVDIFRELAGMIGPERVIWRYDPIFLSNRTTFSYHIENFTRIAELLNGCTERSIISFVDEYRKACRRIRRLARSGIQAWPGEKLDINDISDFIPNLVRAAAANDMELQSCAENHDMSGFGVTPGKCIDDNLLRKLFAINVSSKKDTAQRKACRCIASRDIGMYDSCLFGCSYCYATQSFERARKNHQQHDPKSPSLIGRYDAEPPKGKEKKKPAPRQQRLF
ncbi:DUF1848 domain-containing protein [Desulfogranum japonicum]|uniref:DUF1848 domain-containing protein n=1 Tax=Desulfogranum japonicum TaxID=231447 RepID=UPI0003FADCC9|nr:DUF1848 domain-containing protein [Desulfogranum japonicum]